MPRGLRILGHPPHPIINHLPLGLLPAAIPLDVAGLWSGATFWWAASFWNIVMGLAAGIAAAVAGMLDYAAYVEGRRPQNLTVVHLTLMLSAGGVFAVGLIVRGGPEPGDATARWLAMSMDAVGALLLAAGGWYGGELVYGHGTGVRTCEPRDAPRDSARPE